MSKSRESSGREEGYDGTIAEQSFVFANSLHRYHHSINQIRYPQPPLNCTHLSSGHVMFRRDVHKNTINRDTFVNRTLQTCSANRRLG